MLSTLVICYLFLGGLGSGACLILCCLTLAQLRGAPRQKNGTLAVFEANRLLLGSGYGVALLALVLGAACLAFDLGRIEAIATLLLNPTPTYISIGAYALGALALVIGGLTLAWLFQVSFPLGALRVLCFAGMVLSVVVMLYTGVLLMGTEGVKFWNTLFIPLLFVLSSSSCGLAALMIIAYFSGTLAPYRSLFLRLSKIDALIIAVELIALLAFCALSYLDPHAALSADELIVGSYAPIFWGGLIACGLIAPLALELLFAKNPRDTLVLVASVGVLGGGFLLRWCLVSAAMHPAIVYLLVASGST